MIKRKPLAAVLAATAAVLTAIALIRPSAHTDTAGASRTPSTAASTILHLSGEGSTVTAGFTTGPDWAVLYSFTCPNAAFRVIEQGSVSDGVPLADRTESKGTGTTYVHNETGGHRLRVMSACMWTLTVVNGDIMPRATGGVA